MKKSFKINDLWGGGQFLGKLLSGVALSSLSLVLISSSAHSMCSLPQGGEGTKENPCHCQFPVFDGKELKCGEDYCEKVGKTCMSDGSCCKTLDDEGSNCCDEAGKHKETGSCCEVLTQANCPTGIVDNQTTGCKECCPALETEGCETETDETTGCTVCKVAEISCEANQEPCSNGTDTWCCAEGNTCQNGKCCQDGACCDEGEFAYGYYAQDCLDVGCVDDSQYYNCCDGNVFRATGVWQGCCPKGYHVVSCEEYCTSKGYGSADGFEACVDSNGDERYSDCLCFS